MVGKSSTEPQTHDTCPFLLFSLLCKIEKIWTQCQCHPFAHESWGMITQEATDKRNKGQQHLKPRRSLPFDFWYFQMGLDLVLRWMLAYTVTPTYIVHSWWAKPVNSGLCQPTRYISLGETPNLIRFWPALTTLLQFGFDLDLKITNLECS